MFHAYGLYLYYYQNKKHNKNFKKENSLASSIVLSTLAVPTYSLGTDITGITSESILSQEINTRLSTMLMQTGMITREQLIDLLFANNLLEIATKEVRELFFLLENKFSPLTLSHSVKPLLSKIRENNELKIYIPSIEQLLVGRVLAQLSKCYKTLKLEKLMKLIDFIPAETLEKYILKVSIKTSLCIRIDHSNSAIYFTDVPDILEACTQFNKTKEILIKAHSYINKDYDLAKRKNIIKNVFGNIEEIANQDFELRQSFTDDGKKIIKERDEQLRKKEEEDKKTREIEKRRLEDEMRQREKTHKLATSLNDIERERRALKLQIINGMIEKMRNIGFSSKEMSINKKKIEKMNEEELLEIGPDEFGKLYAQLYEKSVQDRQIQVKQLQKSLEYNERAKREYMNPLILEKWAESTQSEIETKKALIKEKYEKDLALKRQIERIKDYKAEYMEEENKKAKVIFTQVYDEWSLKMTKHYYDVILESAKKRREEEEITKKKEEEKLKEEQERKKKADDNKNKEWRYLNTNEKNTQEKSVFEGKKTYEPKKQFFNREKAAHNESSSIFGKSLPVAQKPAEKTHEIRRNPEEKATEAKRNVEERKEKIEPASGPPRRFMNSKKKNEIDKDGFTKVTKDTHHHG